MKSPRAYLIHLQDLDWVRFTDKVDHGPVEECWPWLGHVDRNGYGKFRVDDHVLLSHRLGWHLHHRQYAPLDMVLDHTCRNRNCCNPIHLNLVLSRVNSRRRIDSKLDAGMVEEIRHLVTDGYTHGEVAKMYNICRGSVSNIMTNRTWF